jgi:NAD-dependent dihydropyrimidine dehydrogenase PreA subunit
MRPYVNDNTCICCGTCESVCQADPIVFEVGDATEVAHPEACIVCNSCIENCPMESIELK